MPFGLLHTLPHYLRWLCEMSGEYSEDVVSLVVDALQLIAQVGVAYHVSLYNFRGI